VLLRHAIVSLACAVAVCAPAHAETVLYSNGNVVGDGAYGNYVASSGANSAGISADMIFDRFTLGAASIVTKFSYGSDFGLWNTVTNRLDSSSDYVGTNWEIWSVDPSTAGPGAKPVAEGTAYKNGAAGLTNVMVSGVTLYTTATVTGLNLNLGAGHYWLGMQNILTGQGASSIYMATDQTYIGDSFASQLYDASNNLFYHNLQGASFTVSGGRNPAVPEPPVWTLMLAGFGLVGGVATLRRWRRLHNAPTG
jgi:hypothetical protein